MKRELTIKNILIIWLIATAMIVVMLMSVAHTHKVSAPTMQWKSDTSWVKSWKF